MNRQRGYDKTPIVATPLRVSSRLAPHANAPAESALDGTQISALVSFFNLLDIWERQSHATEKL
jgi:hypothetical protein